MRRPACFVLLVAVSLGQVSAFASERRIYSLSVRSETEAGFGALLPPDKATSSMTQYTASFTGRISYVVLSHREALVTLEPDALDLAIGDSLFTDKVSSMKSEMKAPILVRLEGGSKIASCQFDPGVSKETQRFERYLLALLQHVAPSSKPRKGLTWTSTEADPIGPYKARYSVVEMTAGRGFLVKKAVTAYLPATGSNAAQNIVSKGTLQFLFDVGGELVAMHGALSQTTSIDHKTTSQGSSRVSMTFLKASSGDVHALDQAVEKLRSQPQVRLFERPNAAAQEADIERSALGTSTQQELLAALDQIAIDPPQDTNDIELKLRALAYSKPESCPELGRRLELAPADGPVFQLIARALISAGTDPAQAALAGVARNRAADWQAESRLIPALVAVNAPSAGLIDSFEALAKGASNPDVREMCTMVTGAFGRQLAMQSSPMAKKVVAKLGRLLASSRTPDDKRIRLLALGNTGSEEAFVAARPFLKSTDPSVRSAAATAMRWVPDPAAPGLLNAALKGDKSADVRNAAAEALGYMAPTAATVAALREALQKDSDANVRGSAMNSLWIARSKFPAVIGDIRRAARSDKSEELRKTATAMLGRG